MKKYLSIFAIAAVLALGGLSLTGCSNPDLPDDYEQPCTSDGCLNDPTYQ